MALYAGLDPQAALAKWYAIRQKPADQLTPEEKDDVANNMVGLSEQNPAAWQAVKQGVNDNGKTRQIFDPQTGQWKDQEVKSVWSHPESWLQLAGAAGVAAPFVVPALAGLGGGSGAVSSGSGLAGMAPSTGVGPLAGGLTGASTAAEVPAGLAAVSSGGKLAGLLGTIGKVGKIGEALSGGVSGGATPQGSAYANEADQLARNRYLEAPVNQAGTGADAAAQRNILRAGLIAKMNPNAAALSVGPYALPNLAPSATGVGFSADMERKLAERMKAGQPLTLSGVQPASQEELDAQKKALDAAGVGSGLNSTITGVGNTISQGARLAGLGKGIYDTVKGLF